MNLKKIATNTKNKITETFNKLILEASKTPTQDEIKILERRSKKFNYSFFSYAVTGAIIVFLLSTINKIRKPNTYFIEWPAIVSHHYPPQNSLYFTNK
ncbi:Uncharacterised protein [Escherichia coli]|nr:Uncharacterised protein [Escherichia coli]SQV32005.1 Uncharacterised protein [Escherichia coli]SQV82720.1 Uncharacterised protein [Escherichia coli]SQV95065.1 Uncharacterised protein [Escherichia coli]SQW07595.1 Uncharacterised protein [Escherichia coli]